MRRFFNREISFGFALGFMALLFILGIASRQEEACVQEQTRSYAAPDIEGGAGLGGEGERRKQEERSYAKSHQWVCGVLGIPKTSIDYMDGHEGFFVATFTFALFIATFFLWRSTEKLWQAGEDARKLSENTTQQQLRAYVSLNGSLISDVKEGARFKVAVAFVNNGQTPAYHVRTKMEVRIVQFPFTAASTSGHLNEIRAEYTLGMGGTCDSSYLAGANITEFQINAIRSKQYAIAAFGICNYFDCFECVRTTEFCLYFGGDKELTETGALSFAPFGNHST